MKILLLINCLMFQSLERSSPDGHFQIKVYGKQLSDLRSELKYYLIEKGKQDSTLLTSSIIRDLQPPNFWWTKDSKYLVFEHKGDSLSINVYEVSSQSITFSEAGYVNSRLNKKALYFDSSNDSILFYKTLGRSKVRLSILNIISVETKIIGEFEHSGPYETPLLTKFDNSTGEIHIHVIGENYNPQTILFNVKSR